MNIKTFNRNTGFDEEKTLSKSDVGLGNVTNDAQVKGIASSTDNAIVRWDSTTGKLVQNSVNIIDDIGNMGIGMTPTCPLSVKNLGTSNVAVLGNDSVLTGNFETDINWTKGANWTIAGTAVHTAGANNLSQTLALTSGTYYQIIVTIITTTVGNLTIQLDGATPVSASVVGQVIGTLTSYEIILLANITSNGIAFVPDATWEGSIDNVTLKPITVAPATTNFYDTTGLITGEIRTHNQALSNIAIGKLSGQSNTTGIQNTFLGHASGNANTTGNYNTFLGHASGNANTTGTQNTFLGHVSGYANTTGTQNTFLGQSAGYANTTGNYNTFLGHASGYANTTGTQNTFLGHASGNANTTGIQNTFLGHASGNANTTGNYNTCIGQGADVSTNNLSNATAVGYGAIVNASNRVWLGNGAANTYVTGGSVYSKSDKRSKKEIKDIPVGLNFINKLRPVSYKFKNYIVPEKIIKGIKDEKNPDKEVKDIIIPAREYTFHREHYGLVAQDVKEAMDELGIDFGGYQDTGFNGEGADDMKALGYSEFIAPLIKAVQELSERIILLEERKVEKHD